LVVSLSPSLWAHAVGAGNLFGVEKFATAHSDEGAEEIFDEVKK